jgi:glucan phosphoethanolaminetransferase (alkaline phosphatase superfamily)
MKWNINKKLLVIPIILFFILLFFKIPISKIIVGVIGYLLGIWYSWKGIFSLFYAFPKAFLGYLKKEFRAKAVLISLANFLLNLLVLVLILLFLGLFPLDMFRTFIVWFVVGFCYSMVVIYQGMWISKSRKDIKEYFGELFGELVKNYRIKSIEDIPQDKTQINTNDFLKGIQDTHEENQTTHR